MGRALGGVGAAARLGPVSPPRAARGPLFAFLALGVLWGGWAALVPTVQAAVGASPGALGAALLFVGAGSLPAMLVAGRLTDRHGGVVLPLSFAGLALAALGPAFAGSVGALAAALLLVGAFSGSADVSINAAVAGLEAESGARLMQLAHALFSVGVVAGAVGVGLARQAGAGRPAALAGPAAVLLAAALANRRPAARHAEAAARPRLRRRYLALGAACAAAFVVEGGIEGWSALFLERDLDAGPALGALGPASYATAMVAGRLSGHRLQHRVGDRALLAGGALVSLAGLALAGGAPSVAVALPGFFLGGAGVSVAAPVLFGAAGRGATPHERGTAVAAVSTLAYLGFLVGPPAVGGIAEAAGLRASFLALAAAAAALAAAATRLRL